MPYRQLAERFLDPPDPKPLPAQSPCLSRRRPHRALTVVVVVLLTAVASLSCLAAAACVTFWVTFGTWVAMVLR